MAAGLGFKTFTTGEVLTAADTNGYLMQGVNVFANAAARTAAITSPQEGQMSYLKDTDSTEYYTGSAWSSVGASNSYTLLSTTTLSGATTTTGTISSAYTNLLVVLESVYASVNNWEIWIRLNGDSGTNYNWSGQRWNNNAADTPEGSNAGTFAHIAYATAQTQDNYKTFGTLTIPRYTSSVAKHVIGETQTYSTTARWAYRTTLNYQTTSAVSTITFGIGSGTFSGGSALIYGVK
jgi:hypothetical protein